MTHIVKRRPVLVAWQRAIVAVVVTMVAGNAFAQQYRTDPIDDRARMKRLAAQKGLRNPAEYSANKADFDEFFQRYYFPLMTRSSPAGLAEVGKLRYELFKQYLWNTSNQQLQSDLTKMAYGTMLRIATNLEQFNPPKSYDPPYHPAVRYNATLVLGMLDEKYAVEAAGASQPPKPYPPATKVLIAIVSRATMSEQFPPPVILAALVGLERHAQYRQALDPASVNAMYAALLKLVNHEKPIQEMDPKAYAWLRLRAASALATLGSVGNNNAVHDALVKLIGELESLDDRTAAAALLAKLEYKDAKIKAEPTLDALFRLARDVAEAEAERAEEFERMQIGGVAGGLTSFRGERFAPTMGGDEEYDPYPRRHVLARLVELRRGLNAVKEAVPEEEQKQVEAVVAALQPAINAARNEKTLSLLVSEAVRKMAVAVQEAAPPADKPASEDELDL